jgi:hypothetical protein
MARNAAAAQGEEHSKRSGRPAAANLKGEHMKNSVIRQNPTTALLSLVAAALSVGVAASANAQLPPEGTILVVTSNVATTPTGTNGPVGIVAVNPSNGSQSYLTQGGLLYFPTDIREGDDDTIYVADGGYPGEGPVPPKGSLSYLGGVYAINPNNGLQTLIVSDPSLPNPQSIAPINGNLIVVGGSFFANGFNAATSYAWVAEVDPKTGHWKIVTDTTKTGNMLVFPEGVFSGPGNTVYVLDAAAGKGNQGAVFQVDRATGEQTLIANVNGPAGAGMNAQGDIIMGLCPGYTCTSSTIVSLNPNTKPAKITTLGSVPQPVGGLTTNNTTDMYMTEYAVGSTPSALFRFNPQTGKVSEPAVTKGGKLGIWAWSNIVFHHNPGASCPE